MDGDNEKFDYGAFISYRHIPRDEQFAEKLHKLLETYHTPKNLVKKGLPKKIKKVFRDRDELPTSSDLSHDIEQALLKSEFLIVICSPEAVQSKWVQKEVEFFGNHHGYDKILTLLVDGEPAEAFPPSLFRNICDENGNVLSVSEPLAADIRPREGTSSLKLLKVEKLRLIAVMLGCKFDELKQREHERRMKRTVTAAASVAVFLSAFGAFTFWQLSEVSAAKTIAVQNEQRAISEESKLYATLARQASDSGDQLLGMSLAMRALPEDIEHPEKELLEEAKGALYYTAAKNGVCQLTTLYPGKELSGQESYTSFCMFTNNGGVVASDRHTLWYFDSASGRLLRSWSAPKDYQVISVSPKGNRAVAAFSDHKNLTVRLYDTENDKSLCEFTYELGEAEIVEEAVYFDIGFFVKADFDQSGDNCLIAYNHYYDGEYDSLYELELANSSVMVLKSADGAVSSVMPDHGAVQSIAFDGAQILVTYPQGFLLYDYVTGKEGFNRVTDMPLKYEFIEDCSGGLTDDGRSVVVRLRDDAIMRYDIATGMPECLGFAKDMDEANAFAVRGGKIAYLKSDSEFSIYDIKKAGDVISAPFVSPSLFELFPDCILSADGRWAVFAGNIFDTKLGTYYPVSALVQNSKYITGYAFSSDGSRLAVISDNCETSIIQLADGSPDYALQIDAHNALIKNNNILLNDVVSGLIVSWDCADKEQLLSVKPESFYTSYYGYLISETDSGYQFYNTDSKSTAQTLGGLGVEYPHDIQVSPDSKYIAVNSEFGFAVLNMETAKTMFTYPDEKIYIGYESFYNEHTLGFFPNSEYAWVTGYFKDGYGFGVFDMTGKMVSYQEVPNEGGDTDTSIAFVNGAGTRVITYTQGNVILWSVDEKMQLQRLNDMSGRVFDYNDDYFVTCKNNNVYIYDWENGALRSSIRNDYSVISAHLADDALLVVDDSGVCAWNVKDGSLKAKLYINHEFEMVDAGVVNDGKNLAIVGTSKGQTFIKLLPYFSSFEQAYAAAQQKLSGRKFDIELDLSHIS